MKVSLLLLVAALCVLPVAGSCKDGALVIWPLSRSGDILILRFPPGYAGMAIDELAKTETDIADAPVEDDLVIMAMWPELTPAPRIEAKNLVPHGATMQALIEPRALASYYGQPMNKLEFTFDSTVDAGRHDACSPGILAISGTITRLLCQTTHELDTKPEKFGLKRMGIDFKKYSDYPENGRGGIAQRDVYYLRDNEDHLQTAIFCTAEEARTLDDEPQFGPVAQCEHRFIDMKLNAMVSVHYRRVYLPEWREIEASWRKLLESFIETPEAKSP